MAKQNTWTWYYSTYIRHNKWLFGLLFSIYIIVSIFQILTSFILARILGQSSIFKIRITIHLVAFFALVSFTSIVLRIIAGIITTFTSSRWIAKMRTDLLTHYTLHLEINPSGEPGEIITRLTDDIPVVIHTTLSSAANFIASLSTIITLFILGVNLNSSLTLILLLSMTSYITLPLILKKKIISAKSFSRKHLASALDWSLMANSAFLVAKFFNNTGQQWFENKTKTYWFSFRSRVVREQLTKNALTWGQDFLRLLFTIVIVLYGLIELSHGTISLTILIAFILFNEKIYAPISSLSQLPISIASIKFSLNRLSSYLINPTFRLNLASYTSDNPIVKVKNATVATNNTVILSNINLQIYHNTTTLIQGANGLGKSLLFSTILGLASSDSINWNNYFISSPQEIAIIPQNIPIFYSTLYENITLGLPISEHQVITQLKRLNWQGGINLDTKYSPNHMPSGGERKRIGTARILLHNPKMVFIDEIEAGLDDPIPIIMTIRQSISTIVVISHYPQYWPNPDQLVTITKNKLVTSSCLSS